MKLKQLPQDFIVEEKTSLQIVKEPKKYAVYSLEKKGIETFALIQHIARKNRISLKNIGIAGLKDKHAITKQYITFPAQVELRTKQGENFKLTLAGYSSVPLKKGDILANRFTVVLRGISGDNIPEIVANSISLQKYGVINYYDSQRFGSVINGRFLTKYVLEKNYEAAVKLYLTSYSKHEPLQRKQDKQYILKHWDDFSQITEELSPDLYYVLNAYYSTKDWLQAYLTIPAHVREMSVLAYQSYLWNECVREYVTKHIDPEYLYDVPYALGKLLLYTKLAAEQTMLFDRTFTTLCHDYDPKEYENNPIETVLKKEGLSVALFNVRKITGDFFKLHQRMIRLVPAEVKLGSFIADSQNKGKQAVTLQFELPKGSYATMITKRIFGR